ncbi:uncharacterized protein LOC116846888 [Odontomachus brunneus]|uniref:uncharacterized protein LOC116846888 n=1 Tax=Odontomachus brunneus TaxID=486640 RepID=UPI0013F188B6|nr:uncharacterized protein LOC116846888 [Odontomachus brunneus]
MEINRHELIVLQSFTGINDLEKCNNFFHPNVCHVCKTSKQSELQTCTDCYMISYCSDNHKMFHQQQHIDICQAVTKVNKNYNIRESDGMTLDEWILFKRNNVIKIQQELGRNLLLYEEQMFLFAKSCFMCYKQTNLVNTCVSCCSVDSCADHNLLNFTHDCKNLHISLALDIEYLMKAEDVEKIRFDTSLKIDDICDNTMLFVERFAKDREHTYWSFYDFYYSDWASAALTLCCVMVDPKYCYLLQKKGTFVIHIIAGTLMNVNNLLAWEIFLHLLPRETILKITMIEPNLENRYRLISDTCTLCHSSDKILYAEYHNLSYEDYVINWEYDKPNVIIGYNIELNKLEIQNIHKLNSQMCPLVLTVTTDNETSKIIQKLEEMPCVAQPFMFVTKNKYRSLRPYKSYATNTSFFHNENLIIYESLNPK